MTNREHNKNKGNITEDIEIFVFVNNAYKKDIKIGAKNKWTICFECAILLENI